MDILSSIGCKSAKISMVGFCSSLVDVLVDPTLLQKPIQLQPIFGEGIVLKQVFKCPGLCNLNIENRNFPALDLGDKEQRIAFQVTVTTGSAKVVGCLQSFIRNELYREYDKLIIFMLQDRQKSYNSEKIPQLVNEICGRNKNFQFHVIEDIVDLRVISEKINDFDTQTKQIIHDILMWEIEGESASPLSKTPETKRQIVDIPLVGRQEEYERLLSSKEDLLLIGQPGTGKTFLLYKLAKEKDAYFVIDKDRSNLTRAIKAQKPEIIVIDDAHRDPDVLTQLRCLRKNENLNFRIIASCWPTSKQDSVKTNGHFSCLELGLLTKDELAEMLKELLNSRGLQGNPGVEQELIDQANGSPGNLVTFFELFMKGKGHDFHKGTVLLSHLNSVAEEAQTQTGTEWIKTRKILAYFSIGGKSGMTISDISNVTQMTEIDITALLIEWLWCINPLTERARHDLP